MTETYFIVCVLLVLHLSLELTEKHTLGRWVGLGLTLGVATLLRQTILIFVPFLLLWLFWELKKSNVTWWHFALPIVFIVMMVAPWTIRNYAVYHEFLPLNSNAGYALYASNHPHLGTQWSNDNIVVPVPEELSGQNEAQIDHALTQMGIQFIVADPERYLRLTVDKTLEYFKFWPSSESGRLSNLVRVLSFGLYLPFMVLGLFFSFSRWRSFTVLYLFIVIHTGVYLLSWPAPRYRLPVDAVSMVFAGLALLEVARQFKSWHRGGPLMNSVSDKVQT